MEKFETMEKFYNDLFNVVKEAYEELKQENEELKERIKELKKDKDNLYNIITFQHRTIDFYHENNPEGTRFAC